MVTSPDLTRDELRRFNLTMLQPKDGYRFTLDPLLLCDFSKAAEEGLIIDLGSGSGVMALILARMSPDAGVVGFEQDQAMAGLAEENARLNSLDGRVSILNEDVLYVRRHLPVSCSDLVVSNPPYRKQGRGRLNPHPGKRAGRHETTAELADFLAAAKYLIKPSGRICMIYHADRLPEFMAEAQLQKLAVLKLRVVHGLPDAEGKLFLVELAKARRQVSTLIMPPLVVRYDADHYTEEVFRILHG